MLIAGLALGLMESVVSTYIGTRYSLLVVFGVLFLVLLVAPKGFLDVASNPGQVRGYLIRFAAVAVGLLALAVVPAFIDPYSLRIVTGALMWAGLACAWNIVGGYAGYISFGHSAFLALVLTQRQYSCSLASGCHFWRPYCPALFLQ